MVRTDDPQVAFQDADYALLVGAMPRKEGMERSDLLQANGGIFGPQGRAINEKAQRHVKVLVVGNPANTNALIAMRAAPQLDPSQFTAMMRLDHNRAITQVAQKSHVTVQDVKKMTIWGNHSATQYPDLFHCEVKGENAASQINDQVWMEQQFIPTVQKRGAAIIKARGLSSAASAANAAIAHMRDWTFGTPAGDWVSMAVPSDGSYGIAEGILCSFPCTTSGGKYQIVQGLEWNAFSRGKIEASVAELQAERDTVKQLNLI